MSDLPAPAPASASTSTGLVEFATPTPAAIEPTLTAGSSDAKDRIRASDDHDFNVKDDKSSSSPETDAAAADSVVSTLADVKPPIDDGSAPAPDQVQVPTTPSPCALADGGATPGSTVISPSHSLLSKPFLPREILGMIVALLPPSGVNIIAQLSQEHFRLINPYLYASIRLVTDTQCRLLVRGIDNGVRQFTAKHEYFQHTKELTLSFIPDVDTLDILGTLVSLSHTPETPLMPNVAQIHFDEGFTSCIHRAFSRSHSHSRGRRDPGFLCVMSRPSSLRFDYNASALRKCYACTDDMVRRLSYRWNQPLKVITRNTSFDAVYLAIHNLAEARHILATPTQEVDNGSQGQPEDEVVCREHDLEETQEEADAMLDEIRWAKEILEPHFMAILNESRNGVKCERVLVFESLGPAEVSVIELAMVQFVAKRYGKSVVETIEVDGPDGTKIKEKRAWKVKFVPGIQV